MFSKCLLPILVMFPLVSGGQESRVDLTLAREGHWLIIRGAHLPGGEIRVNYLEAYCRADSTDADWVKHTVIPHRSEVIEAPEDGRLLRLRDTLADGLVVEHTIVARSDEVDFRVLATNPGATRSEAHWAQPCVRLGVFTGFVSAGTAPEDYLPKCFVFVGGKLTRLPLDRWTTTARYTPGQVWGAPGVPASDLNPRPHSRVVPSHGLIGCFSGDERWIFATAWDPAQELFQGVARCLHSDFRLGGIEPGGRVEVRGKIYVLRADADGLRERYERDFAGQYRWAARAMFDAGNLVAWCIVPFDAKKRTPAQRAEMLSTLGIGRLAYDWRPEHVEEFESEIAAMKKSGIEITAWWFPRSLDETARRILDLLAKHGIAPQLWVTGGGSEPDSAGERARRIEEEAARIRPIAEAAGGIGCRVGLYNHGGWFGEPANQIAIIDKLREEGIGNVGIVYNLHHGHDHLKEFEVLLAKMKPHLIALNLNGMSPGADRSGQKIHPIGQGSEDLRLLEIIARSGWHGPVGILDHRPETDSERTLRENLDGLRGLVEQLEREPPGGK